MQVTNVTGTSLTLTWEPQTTAQTGYQIYLVDPNGPAGNQQLIGTAGAGATSFNVSNLSQATQYTFQVQATNSNSGQSSGLAAPASGPMTTPHDPTGEVTPATGAGTPDYVTEHWEGGEATDPDTGDPIPDSETRYTDGDLTLKLSDLPRHTYVWSNFRIEGWAPEDQPIPTITATADGTSLIASPVVAYTHQWVGQQNFVNYGWSFNLPSAQADGVKHQGDEYEVTFHGEGFGSDANAGNSWYPALAGVNTILPFVTISGSGTAIEDGSGDGQITVTRSGSGTLLDDPLDVKLQDVGGAGDAVPGTDYDPITSLSIDGNASTKSTAVTAKQDDVAGGVKGIYLAIADSADYGHATVTTAPATGPATTRVGKADDVSVQSIKVERDDEVDGSMRAYGCSFGVKITIVGENVGQLEVRQLLKTSSTWRDWNGLNMTTNQILGEINGDPHTIDTAGKYELDWDWVGPEETENTKGGEGTTGDTQLINVTNRPVVIGNTQATEVRRATTRRDFRIEVRKKGTTNVLKTFDWGYTWDNDNAAWTNANNPPPPNGDTCAGAHLGTGEIKDVVGITGIPW